MQYPPMPIDNMFLSVPVCSAHGAPPANHIIAFVCPSHAAMVTTAGCQVRDTFVGDAAFAAHLLCMPLCVVCGGACDLDGACESDADRYDVMLIDGKTF